MPQYDYQCIVCEKKRENVMVSNYRDAQGHLELCECGGEMRKLPAAPNFQVKGFNAANHYGAKHE